MEILKLPIAEQQKFYKEVRDRIGLNEIAIEKDLWVTAVLRSLFTLSYPMHYANMSQNYAICHAPKK